LDLHDVRDLYERTVITNTVGGAISNMTSGVHAVEYAKASALGDDQDIIVLVHGYNNTDWSWLSSGDTVFKRLFWVGYRGKLATVRWPCKRLVDGLMAFNRSEFNAYKASTAMTAYLNQLRNRFPEDRLHVLAHSQGGAISSEALSQGAPFDTLILSQVAIPASSYDVNAPVHSGLSATEGLYGPTPEWRVLGYRGIYTNLTGRILNFYNTNDPVLAIWINDQGAAKPNVPATDYRYDGTNGIYDPPFGSSYIVTDPQESRAFVSRSRTESIGRSPPESGHGAIQSGIDLKARFGFDNASSDDHSAQWAWPIQTARPYFLQVLISCQIQPGP
jgi:pimeloyl-ACP methyl ester carboxylesterase